MDRSKAVSEELSALAAQLTADQPRLLAAWRTRANADPRVTAANSLSRSQFNDHIPDVLQTLAQRLQAWPSDPATLPERDAATHGLQRWQQGYRLREVAQEWTHLQMVLIDYLDDYHAQHPQLRVETVRVALRAVAELCSVGVSESVARYFELEQVEAAGNLHDLERTLEQVRQLERQRADLWQQVAHDLRGHTHLMSNAAAGLTLTSAGDAGRDKFLSLLQRSMTSLHSMLDDVTSLARLQAGHEQLEVRPFDAANVLREMCEQLHPHAQQRGLYLRYEGPEPFKVEGDETKVRRIAQNLLLNAVKYTQQGGVTVKWGDSRANDPARWMMTLIDTGPGFAAGPREPIVTALKAATREAHRVDRRAGVDVKAPAHTHRAPEANGNYERGEGVGLSIVKRLSELLDATVELESDARTGTIFRVIFPRRYPQQDIFAGETLV